MTEGGGSATLVAAGDVRTHLRRYDITDPEIAVACKLVAGWLREDSGGAVAVPLPEGDPLWSAAFELVVLAVTNPASMASVTRGPTASAWPVNPRAAAIRQEVRDRALRAGQQPSGHFPPAPVYPDPALPGLARRGGWGWW